MFGNVLVGVDGRSGGRDAIAFAKQLVDRGARITLVHVYGDVWTLGRGGALLLAIERADSEQMLERERDAASVEAELLSSPASAVGRALHELAEHHKADLLVIGSCRRGLVGRTVMGDETRASLNGAPCAVAIAPRGYDQLAPQLTTIGVGYDSSPESELALAAARVLARRLGAKIRALSVVSLSNAAHDGPIPDNWPEIVKQLIDAELERLHGLDDVEAEATYGEPSEELAHFSEGLSLLIVGSRGYGPLGRVFNGSTSSYLERRAPCPLLVLPRGLACTEHVNSLADDAHQPVGSRS
jgi:nucleotide-binding universal stress UspA family protein